jgi:hypothetical protein
MEGVFLAPALSLKLSFFLRPEIGKNFETGTPTLEFHFPVNHDCRWNDDQVRTPYSSVTG